MQIRSATLEDQYSITKIYHEAFDEDERDIVSTLAVSLLSEKSSPPTLSFVAQLNDSLIGHIAFTPVGLKKSKVSFSGYILAPLAVIPEQQKKHVGTTLVTRGLNQLAEMKVHLVFVYGDPNYYHRFGFNPDVAAPFHPPYPLQYPHGWLALELRTDIEQKIFGEIECVMSLCDPKLW